MLAVLLMASAPVDLAGAVRDAVRPCPERGGAGGEIVVCAKRGEVRSPYRLPADEARFDPHGAIDSVSRERHRLIDGDGASPDLSLGSCSAVGASGFTGCMVRDWHAAIEQRAGAK